MSLLQRLLAEQRERLEEECKKLQRQIAMKSEVRVEPRCRLATPSPGHTAAPGAQGAQGAAPFHTRSPVRSALRHCSLAPAAVMPATSSLWPAFPLRAGWCPCPRAVMSALAGSRGCAQEAGSALSALKESMSAEAAAKAKEERVELLRRQSLRRIKNKDIAAGWAAWFELWSAKTYAMARLRECGNKLHTPGLMVAFGTWAEWWTALKRAELEKKLG